MFSNTPIGRAAGSQGLGRVQTSVHRPCEFHLFVLQFSRLDKDNLKAHFNQ